MFVTIQGATVIVTVIATVTVTAIVTVIVYRSHFFAHQKGKERAMSSWSPPPAPLPDWAQDQEGDDKKLKDVKALLYITTAKDA